MVEEFSGRARVLSGYCGHFLQHPKCTERDVFQVADGGGYQIEGSHATDNTG